MNENDKKKYLEKYQQAKKQGVPFFPDILFKDAVIALLVFLVLVGLAVFVGAPLEERANPADSSYTPRPEWYFLFLFQLLKYFPGNLEVIGVIVIPGIVLTLLVLLPLLDKSPKRYFQNRPWVTGITSLLVLGILSLTVLAFLEAPPPAEVQAGDPVAALYTENCSTCHGPAISVPAGLDLHTIIAQGTHRGMPAWSGDLSTDEIDALAGFITSPTGNDLYRQYCLECHDVSELIASNPLELKNSLEAGDAYPPHSGLEITYWEKGLTNAEITSLLNFLLAPDGQRLFAINCAACHGESVAYSGDESQLREIISAGGLHLDMPAWQGALSEEELNSLAAYVVSPEANPRTADLFAANCSTCHGERVPIANNIDAAREAIASGGAHQTMPVWGETLTDSQLDALTAYTWAAARGETRGGGQSLFTEYCSACHGTFGEGGRNPARADDVIAPISSAEYLTTRDDSTLYNIISQGQPDFGMSPFGSAYGGPLDDDQIDAIIAFMRGWEDNPPVQAPAVIQGPDAVSLTSQQVFDTVCGQCHLAGGSGAGPDLGDAALLADRTDQDLVDSIKNGHPSTAMIAFGGLLPESQIEELVGIIRRLGSGAGGGSGTLPSLPSFASDIRPVLEAECDICHGSMGGWDGSSRESVISSGNNGPAVIPGDAENSLLVKKLLDLQETGGLMPPSGQLAEGIIQLFINWINGGAPDN